MTTLMTGGVMFSGRPVPANASREFLQTWNERAQTTNWLDFGWSKVKHQGQGGHDISRYPLWARTDLHVSWNLTCERTQTNNREVVRVSLSTSFLTAFLLLSLFFFLWKQFREELGELLKLFNQSGQRGGILRRFSWEDEISLKLQPQLFCPFFFNGFWKQWYFSQLILKSKP